MVSEGFSEQVPWSPLSPLALSLPICVACVTGRHRPDVLLDHIAHLAAASWGTGRLQTPGRRSSRAQGRRAAGTWLLGPRLQSALSRTIFLF